MLPQSSWMHIVKSFHSESHFGGLGKLPSNLFLRGISQKSWFYRHFLALAGAPTGPPLSGAPEWGDSEPRSLSPSHRVQAALGWARLASASGFGWLLLGFRLDFGWISAGFDFDFDLISAGV